MRKLLIAALILCAACSGRPTPTATPAPPTATPTPTALYSTHTGPLVRATLPPTWTPTFTPLPTDTWTPTPVTPTETATPVPALADLCASVQVNNPFPDGHTFHADSVITLIYGTHLTAVRDASGQVVALTVRYLARQMDSGQNFGVQLDGGQVFAMQLPASQLPGLGHYHWTVAVYGDGIGEQCLHEGDFFVVAAETTPEVTSEATASP